MDSIQSPAPAEQAQFCPACGQAVSGSNFCSSCGHNMGFTAAQTIADPDLQVGIPPSGPRRGSRARAALLAAGGGLLLAALALAALIITTSRHSTARAATPSYQQRVTRALRPLISANSHLSGTLGALSASAASRSAATRAATQAQTAMNTTQGAVNALTVPAAQQPLSRSVQQALTAENGYLQAVTSTLQTPGGSSAGQLQTLATGAQTALVGLNGLIPTAGASISGASTLQSWAHGRASASAHHHTTVVTATQTETTAAPASQAAPGSGAGGASATSSVSCGDGLMAGPHTSCPFAENVQQAYDDAPGAYAEVTAYSPVTDESYQEQCGPTDSGGIECVGVGNSTSIWWI